MCRLAASAHTVRDRWNLFRLGNTLARNKPAAKPHALMKLDLALPLFALIDRQKVDPDKSDLAQLAEQLGAHIGESHGIEHEAVAIEGGPGRGDSSALYLVLLGVPESSWPAFLALAEVQRAQPFAFRTDGSGRFTLHPLGKRRA